MAQLARKHATYADVEALPEHLRGEILNGELCVSPRPFPLHARAATRLVGQLDGPFDLGRGGPGGGGSCLNLSCIWTFKSR